MFEQMIGSRKTTPPRMLRIVPFGELHIFLRPNSSTRASSGVIVAHFTPTPCCLIAFGGVDRDLVVGRVAVLDAEVVVVELDVEVRQDQPVLDELPDDARHLVAVELDDGVQDLDLRHVELLDRRGTCTRLVEVSAAPGVAQPVPHGDAVGSARSPCRRSASNR